MPTARVQALRLLRSVGVAATLESTTQRVVALRSNLTRQLGRREQLRRLPLVLIQDRWLIAVVITALVASITATVYSFQHHVILLYSDAYFHLRIARRIFDSATPGIGQLGTTWVPLPHLLMLPFVWPGGQYSGYGLLRRLDNLPLSLWQAPDQERNSQFHRHTRLCAQPEYFIPARDATQRTGVYRDVYYGRVLFPGLGAGEPFAFPGADGREHLLGDNGPL
jgi:hypothetical protein